MVDPLPRHVGMGAPANFLQDVAPSACCPQQHAVLSSPPLLHTCVTGGLYTGGPWLHGAGARPFQSTPSIRFTPNIHTCVTGGPSASDPFSKRASGAKQATHSNPFGDDFLPQTVDGDRGGCSAVSGQDRKAEPEGAGLQLGLKDLDTGVRGGGGCV